MPNLVQLMKQAAIEAVEDSKPTAVLFGTVEQVSPLVVRLEQKLALGAAHLVLSSLVSDVGVEVTVDGVTKTHRLQLGLKPGEKVLLFRVQGGQKYLVWDRVR